jgi:peptidoglycan/xylan/chitin deacetylase (PgdA/CDA1 family)
LWNVDSEDWKKPGVPAIINRVMATVHDRAVILMHDGGGDRSETVAALQWILPALKAEGYSFVSIC